MNLQVCVNCVAINCNFRQDESYTPSLISIRTGTHLNDLQEILKIDLDQPGGWNTIYLRQGSDLERSRGVDCFSLQLAIIQNHLNGRDSHVRQMRIFSSRGQAHFDIESGLQLARDSSSSCVLR